MLPHYTGRSPRAAQADGDSQLTETALRGAVDARPTLAALMQLGTFYISAN